MAKEEIGSKGLDNSVVSSAVVVTLSKALKEYLMKHTSGKAQALVSKVSIKSLGKGIAYANVANYANQTVADLLPHVNAAVTWVGALPANILNQTIGRIPVLGKVFRWLHNFITDTVSTIADFIGFDALAQTGSTFRLEDPDKGFETEIDWKTGKTGQKGLVDQRGDAELKNDPMFYTNLELHKTFSIPGSYTKTTLLNGTMATPVIAVHRLTENPMPDIMAFTDRMNQKFSLIKAVRGLSATSYTLLDLANYERCAKMMLHVYYSLKKVIQAAKTYSVVQVGIGDNIITSLGFVPAEVRENLANYETLLCQIHRLIQNNFPMTGLWIKRFEYLHNANIPDYSDKKIATIHMFAICMTDVFADTSGTKYTFDCIPGAQNNDYSKTMAFVQSLSAAVMNSTLFQQLIADYFGAFGSMAMWSDKDYPQYKEALNLSNADNDLSREQIKNAFYINAKPTFITVTNGVPNAKRRIDMDDVQSVQVPGIVFPNTININALNGLTYNTLMSGNAYKRCFGYYNFSAAVTDCVVLFPDTNGVRARVGRLDSNTNETDAYMDNEITPFTLHKDAYSEGESLEISQFKVRCLWNNAAQESSTQFQATCLYKTNEFSIVESVIYVWSTINGTPQYDILHICNESISDDDLQDVESPVDFPDEISAWALIDWMPWTHFTFFGYDSNNPDYYYPHDVLLSDVDGYGSLDSYAFATSINYTIFSLLGANVGIGKKRLDNLAEAYKAQAEQPKEG